MSRSVIDKIEIINQVENKFIIGTIPSRRAHLVAIDQHALHERVNLEQLELIFLAQIKGEPVYELPEFNLHRFKNMVMKLKKGDGL